MSGIFQLWLPILATGVLIFVASSLIHMVFKWHNSDYRPLGNEDEVRAAIRHGAPAPGQYLLPYCADVKDMQGTEMRKKYVEGPIAFLTVRANGVPTMAPALTQWFIYTVAIAAITGGIALQTYGLKGDPRHAAHLVGVMSLLAYAAGSVQMGIWMGKPWRSVGKDVLDGVIYGVISAFTFMWLWPSAT
jgi:hypothetical protein